MVALLRQSLIRSLPVWCAAVGGVIVVAIFLLISTEALETVVWTTGVAAVVPAAAPPLGTTARFLLALGGGVLTAALLWSSLFLLVGPGGFLVRSPRRADGVPAVRRADAHPDAPPRKPMTAADLGTPMMEVGVGTARDERTIPVDLDLPLAAFDPTAILPAPMAPMRPVASLQHPIVTPSVTASPDLVVALAAVEPIESLAAVVAAEGSDPEAPEPEAMEETLAPPAIELPSPPSLEPAEAPDEPEPSGPQSIEALLRRLEKGAGRRRRLRSH